MLVGDGSTWKGKSYLCVHNVVDLYDAQLSSPNLKSYCIKADTSRKDAFRLTLLGM